MARTRSGGQCQRHPVPGRTRCRLHGGLSTGPKTSEDLARVAAMNFKHGRRTKAVLAAEHERGERKRQVAYLKKIIKFIRWTVAIAGPGSYCTVPDDPERTIDGLRAEMSNAEVWETLREADRRTLDEFRRWSDEEEKKLWGWDRAGEGSAPRKPLNKKEQARAFAKAARLLRGPPKK